MAYHESCGYKELPFDELLFASGNRNKYNEFLELVPRSVAKRLLFAQDLPDSVRIPPVEETGSSYMMNALLKAVAWSEASGLPCIADDSGLEVRAIGWEPGIYSARVVGEGEHRLLANDTERNQWLLIRLRNESDRRADFVAAVALSVPEKWTIACEGVCCGHLTISLTGANGFGYDPLFIPDGYNVSFAELSASVKNSISHRARALVALFDILKGA